MPMCSVHYNIFDYMWSSVMFNGCLPAEVLSFYSFCFFSLTNILMVIFHCSSSSCKLACSFKTLHTRMAEVLQLDSIRPCDNL